MLRRPRDEDGAALVIALVFLIFISVLVTASLNIVFTDTKATPVIRANRALAYDADAALQYAIATIRVNPNQGLQYSCDAIPFPGSSSGFTLNQSISLQVNCSPEQPNSPLYYQRHVQLQVVCVGSTTGPCANPLLRADVRFYDDKSLGRTVVVTTWSGL
ncbi:MAG: hypothetical protein ACTHMS_19185 [Jatrophihabitans sp.]|uniref:hypothetical protein n=1 Tax=Jatrophihabitans sp. TaxID=1932789 RepID=UPI003F7E4031